MDREETAKVWRCKKCDHTELRSGPGPHHCTVCVTHRDLFGDGTHDELCNGEMEEACQSTDTNAKVAE